MDRTCIIPIFMPNLKLKENYIFCDTKEKEVKKIKKSEFKKIIEKELLKLDNETNVELVIFTRNIEDLISDKENILELISKYIKENKITSVKISTRPESINKENIKVLKKYKVKSIEILVPSSNDYILKKSNAQIMFSDIKKTSKLLRWNGFKVGYQMMVGLPESTRLDEINTAKALIKLKPNTIKIFPVLVLKGTTLEKEYNNEKYVPLNLVQAVEICKELVRLFWNKKIEILQIGVEDREELNEFTNSKTEVLDGPYHPSFKQLVESNMWYDAIVNKIKRLNVKVKEVEVTVNPIDSDNVIGLKKENVYKLKDMYDVDLILKQDEKVKKGKSKIEITKTYNDFLEEN